MKISSAKLKQIIKEEIGRFLKEQSAVTINFEGTTTSIEFLGMETKYDQTETKLRINGEVSSFGAYDVDGLADDVIAELGDNDDYWFLGDYPDEPQVSEFKRKLEDALEGMGADPESASETRASYSPENVYELKQIIKEEIEALGEAGFTSLSTGPGIQVTNKDMKAAENLFAQIKDNKVNVRMKNVIADIDDDDKFYGLKEQYLNFLKNNILIAFPEYKEFSEGAKAHIMNLIENDLDDYVYDMTIYGEPMNESIGSLMKDLGYEKARKAVESAIDFDEKVENMEDLKALIAKLRSEKDPMGRGRKEELDDIKAALRKMSK